MMNLDEKFWNNIVKQGNCWVWTATRHRQGYGRMSFGRGNSPFAHRFSYELLCGPVPEGMKVCHGCDNPPCVRPDHLFLGTQKDNMQDAYQKGRMVIPHGSEHVSAKLTEEDVAEIRRLYKGRGRGGPTLKQLANQFGVYYTTIHKIIIREAWGHVP